MERVSFNEEPSLAPSQVHQSSAMVRFMLSTGIVTKERQAEYVLLIGAVILILVAALVFWLFSGSHAAPLTPASPGWISPRSSP